MIKKQSTPLWCVLLLVSTAWTAPSETQEPRLLEKVRELKGYAAKKLLRSFHTTASTKRDLVIQFYERAVADSQVLLRPPLRLQTGPYKRLYLTDSLFRTKCLKELIWSAEQLQNHFPTFSFQLDGRIDNCKNLEKGVRQILAHKSKVESNVSRFHTPMHTVYLTNKTKFNHHQVGEMGLYINVNQPKEIQRRLIDFQVGVNDITHETAQVY